MGYVDSLPVDVSRPRGRDIIDDPSSLEHVVWPYRLALPFMNALAVYVHAKKSVYAAFGTKPETNSMFVDGISINSRRVKDGSARWPALDTTYNYRSGEGGTVLARAIDHFWMQVRNAQAVRNRLKIAKHELRAAMRAIESSHGNVRILSLAAGTAQGVIEVAAELSAIGVDVQIVLVDQDRTALAYARKLADLHGLSDRVRVFEGDVLFFNRALDGFQPNIVELMGLVDYLPNKLAVALFKKVRRYMQTGGYFFTCHIHPNSESYFLKHVVDWDMTYRTEEQLRDLLIDGHFLDARILTEPHGIHSIAVCTKAT